MACRNDYNTQNIIEEIDVVQTSAYYQEFQKKFLRIKDYKPLMRSFHMILFCYIISTFPLIHAVLVLFYLPHP